MQANCFNAIISLIGKVIPDRIQVNLCLNSKESVQRRCEMLDECTNVIEYLSVIFVKYERDDRLPTLQHFNKISHYPKTRKSCLYVDVVDCFGSNVFINDHFNECDHKPKSKVRKKKCPSTAIL